MGEVEMIIDALPTYIALPLMGFAFLFGVFIGRCWEAIIDKVEGK